MPAETLARWLETAAETIERWRCPEPRLAEPSALVGGIASAMALERPTTTSTCDRNA